MIFTEEELKTDYILKYFLFDDINEELNDIASYYALLADMIIKSVPRTPERTVALRKLLESKDAAFRACDK